MLNCQNSGRPKIRTFKKANAYEVLTQPFDFSESI